MTLLNVRDLTIGYDDVRAVQEVNLTVEPGERVGIVGESGSGKTTLALALMRLLPPAATVLDGSITLDGVDLNALPEARMRPLRGSLAGMVFQDPLTSFDPLRTLGDHLSEGLRAHGVTTGRKERAVRALRSVGMPAPESQLARRPHELSGGMRQRGMIALGLANEPRLLIADEPTTALDVTIQAQIMDLFATIGAPGPRERLGLVMVSHNLGLVRQLCTRVVVMYAGRIVEDSPAERFFAAPRHPYSIALRDATPRLSGGRGEVSSIPGHAVDLTDPPPGCPFEPRCSFRTEICATSNPSLVDDGDGRRAACHHVDSVIAAPPSVPARGAARSRPGDVLVEARGIAKTYRVRGRNLKALAGVDLDLRSGETVAVVGESGSGKSTLAHVVLGLLAPTGGTIRVAGHDPAQRRSPVRREQKMQAVFQDPHGSLNPRQRVRDIIAEPMLNAGIDRTTRRARVTELLSEVRLGAALADRYPHELSGGQAQRVAIARALAARPELIVLDEPTASLDVSIQTHVISLLRDLQAEHALAYLFVSHDLIAVRELADRIAVMYLGRLVELAAWDVFFARPLHPYSVALLSALPRADVAPGAAERIVLSGEPPSAWDIPAGCPFHPRCPVARDVCASTVPPLVTVDNRSYACHFPGSLPNPPVTSVAAPAALDSASPATHSSSESDV